MAEKKRSLTISSSNKRFRDSVAKLYPELSKSEIKPLADGILGRLSDYIEDGYSPAIAKPKPDGSMDIVVLFLEEKSNTKRKQKGNKR